MKPELAPYQREFIEYSIQRGVIRFGEFELKSGRVSPYFFNSGLFCTGESLSRLAGWYAQAVIASGVTFDMLYGPAYKGVPLATALAIALHTEYQRDLPYCFNRKEAKDHGEGGATVGAPLAGRVLIVDDVISAGTSVRESVDIIRAAGARAVAVAISLDRQERGQGAASAIEEVREGFGLEVVSIARLEHLMAWLQGRPELEATLEQVRSYRDRYGV